MKGIILAGGTGSRLHPLTLTVSKQLMPVYDKPMIYYPLSTLISIGITEILIISTPQDASLFKNLLGDGSQLGCNFQFAIQKQPKGIAEALLIGEKFVGNSAVSLILGDNIFYGSGFSEKIKAFKNLDGAVIFAYHVTNPQRYGVVEFDKEGKAISIEEKPKLPKSNYAIPGLYFYDNEAIAFAKQIKPSKRGELEITDINKKYLSKGKLVVSELDRGTAWLDTGTFESLIQAAQFVKVIEDRQGLKIGCIEEVAFRNNFITETQLRDLAEPLLNSGYGTYLLNLLK